MGDLWPTDTRVADNQAEQDIVQRIAAKLQQDLAKARRPQGQGRRGIRLVAQQFGDLTTDQRAWQPGQGTPPLAHERAQPSPLGGDAMDPLLARQCGFILDGSRRYSLEEASTWLQRVFGDNIELRCAAKSRLSQLGVLRESLKPARVPAELKQLKERMPRERAEEATVTRPLTLQQRLQGLRDQIEALLDEADDEGDEENEGDGWCDPRRQDMRAAAAPRTDSRGVLINAAGAPVTLRSNPYPAA